MPRYIFISFLFLGWAFFELSGGTDFQPQSRGAVVAEAAEPQPAPQNSLKRAQQARAREIVTLASAETAVPEPEPQTPANTLTLNAQNIAAPETEAPGPETSVAGLSQYQASPQLAEKVAWLQNLPAAPEPAPAAAPEPAPAAAETAVRAPVAASADLRQVVATRVNMREGPSTDTDILDRLERGHTVEVLDNNGRGWLRLRALPEDRVGWIAERLVSPAN